MAKLQENDVKERQWQMDFARFDEQTRGRIESDTAFKLEIVNPTKLKQGKAASPYHDVLTKDLKISFTNREDSEIGMQYLRIINSCIFLGGDTRDLDESALIYHAELEGFLGLKGSESGQFLEELNTIRQQLSRTTADVSNNPVQKMSWR